MEGGLELESTFLMSDVDHLSLLERLVIIVESLMLPSVESLFPVVSMLEGSLLVLPK